MAPSWESSICRRIDRVTIPPCVEPLPWEFVFALYCLTCPPWQCIPSPTHLICIALEGTEGIGGAMAFEGQGGKATAPWSSLKSRCSVPHDGVGRGCGHQSRPSGRSNTISEREAETGWLPIECLLLYKQPHKEGTRRTQRMDPVLRP